MPSYAWTLAPKGGARCGYDFAHRIAEGDLMLQIRFREITAVRVRCVTCGSKLAPVPDDAIEQAQRVAAAAEERRAMQDEGSLDPAPSPRYTPTRPPPIVRVDAGDGWLRLAV